VLAGVPASNVAIATNGDVAAAFPGLGLFLFGAGGSSLRQLSPLTPVTFDMASSGPGQDSIIASFAGFGVFTFDASGFFRQLVGAAASAVAITPERDVVAAFPGFGLFFFQHNGFFRPLSPVTPTQVAISEDPFEDVGGMDDSATDTDLIFANFPFGVFSFDTSGNFRQLAGLSALAFDAAPTTL
jgi:hypothetical protein